MVVIGASSSEGRCYMETSTLDGEKNLKPRECIKHGNMARMDIEIDDNKEVSVQAVEIHGKFYFPSPTYVLYEFEGGYVEYYD